MERSVSSVEGEFEVGAELSYGRIVAHQFTQYLTLCGVTLHVVLLTDIRLNVDIGVSECLAQVLRQGMYIIQKQVFLPFAVHIKHNSIILGYCLWIMLTDMCHKRAALDILLGKCIPSVLQLFKGIGGAFRERKRWLC